MTSLPETFNAALIQLSFTLLMRNPHRAAMTFYSNLFGAHPDARPNLSSHELYLSHQAFWRTLRRIVYELESLPELEVYLSTATTSPLFPDRYEWIATALEQTLEDFLKHDALPAGENHFAVLKAQWKSAARLVVETLSAKNQAHGIGIFQRLDGTSP